MSHAVSYADGFAASTAQALGEAVVTRDPVLGRIESTILLERLAPS